MLLKETVDKLITNFVNYMQMSHKTVGGNFHPLVVLNAF